MYSLAVELVNNTEYLDVSLKVHLLKYNQYKTFTDITINIIHKFQTITASSNKTYIDNTT